MTYAREIAATVLHTIWRMIHWVLRETTFRAARACAKASRHSAFMGRVTDSIVNWEWRLHEVMLNEWEWYAAVMNWPVAVVYERNGSGCRTIVCLVTKA